MRPVNRYLLFDTETTSLVQNTVLSELYQPEIIEFYGIEIDEKGTEYNKLHFFCAPRRAVPKEVTDITGITNERLRNEQPFARYFDDVKKLMGGCDAIVAHNLSFDMQVLITESERLDRRAELIFPRLHLCTVEQTEWLKGFRLSLTDLHEFLFGLRFEGAHSAANDVQALKRCFVELINRGWI